MNDSKVARRYANSLLGLAIEQNIADKVNNDMLLVSKTCENNRELSLLLKNPIINTDKKDTILTSLFGNKVSEISKSFMQIITRKGRENHLEDIASAYVSLYKEIKGIKTAYVTTAFKMDDALRSQVMEMVKRAKGDNAELIENIDKNIIGGFILRIGDVQFDASISNKLNSLKSQLGENLYVKEY